MFKQCTSLGDFDIPEFDCDGTELCEVEETLETPELELPIPMAMSKPVSKEILLIKTSST